MRFSEGCGSQSALFSGSAHARKHFDFTYGNDSEGCVFQPALLYNIFLHFWVYVKDRTCSIAALSMQYVDLEERIDASNNQYEPGLVVYP